MSVYPGIVLDAHAYVGRGAHLQQTVDDLLRQMDAANVGRAVICPVDRCLAVHNREGNDLVATACREHDDRLTGMAVSNPWFGEAAVDELRRAFDNGLRGLFIHSVYQGFVLSDPLVNPLLELAVERRASVYVHTGTAGLAEPYHAAELGRRFPDVRFLMGHAGSSDYGEDAVGALSFANNLYLETSRNGPANYGLWKVRECVDRVVFGSSSPEYLPITEIATVCDIFTDAEQQRAIFHDNLNAVFGGELGS